MFTVLLMGERSDMLQYIKEQRKTGEFASYPSFEEAIHSLSVFFLQTLCTEILKEILGPEYREEKRDEYTLYIPSSSSEKSFEMILAHVQSSLQRESSLHMDGFFTFRLKNARRMIREAIQEGLHPSICEKETHASIQSVKESVTTNPKREEVVFLRVQREKISLFSKEHVYLSESPEQEDVVLGHLILLSPKRVHVIGDPACISEESRHILSQIWEDNITFFAHKS
ncbi:hypothetical protein IMZ31_20230 (plasmid) [Pontibacillus sp. ALD_SL1]|uniref:sporulation protein YtxC n=1 Tax=Pontibacillus sp. ALD_SL1 TaxID=2777185 RepID=UPI001A9734C7|nr:sporulation protein YtxC [Pontibacillus sp. ALD_SL1]QST02879.1 hypothetical protein IMZ31_20230 [Pontibacillus sp. ALD_SL1]